jgi:quercetin dioxygenase-like cupin family protein
MSVPLRRACQLAALAGALGLAAGVALGRTTYPPVEVLLQTSTSVIGQPLAYPAGTPQVTAAIVTLAPGQATGWHHHAVPLLGYILEGELTVDYGPDGTRTYRPGDVFMEAFRTDHDGRSSSAGPVRLLAVYMVSSNDRASMSVDIASTLRLALLSKQKSQSP